jgi:hypothetical protein
MDDESIESIVERMFSSDDDMDIEDEDNMDFEEFDEEDEMEYESIVYEIEMD